MIDVRMNVVDMSFERINVNDAIPDNRVSLVKRNLDAGFDGSRGCRDEERKESKYGSDLDLHDGLEV